MATWLAAFIAVVYIARITLRTMSSGPVEAAERGMGSSSGLRLRSSARVTDLTAGMATS